jgi:4-hydroxy-3-methylbut-2-en-1-yl diphosphate synthase IspG/GcpE
MMFFNRWRKAVKELKKAETQEKIQKSLTEDPITVELIAKIAKEYKYHFEIAKKDGTRLIFYKEGIPRFDDLSDREFF